MHNVTRAVASALLISSIGLACSGQTGTPPPGGASGRGGAVPAPGGPAPGGGPPAPGGAGVGGAGTPVAPDPGAPPGGGATPPDATQPVKPAPAPGPATPAAAVPPFKAYDSPCRSRADPDVAVSADFFATAIQWNAYFFNKATGVMDHMYKWTALRGRLISDTHIVYDRSSLHWFITTIVDLGNNSFGVQVMVSDAAAKTWTASIPVVRTTGLIDDPQPTVTSDKVVITESGKCIWAVDKAALIAGTTEVVPSLSCTLAQNNQVAAIKYGGDPPATAYAIVMADSTHLNWISTEGPAVTAKVTEHKIQVPPVNEAGLFSITQGGKPGLESGQVKGMWQNNHLVWNKTVKCGTDTCVRSFDVDTAANSVKSDDFAVPGSQVFYGASGLDRGGNMWLVASQTKPAGFVGLGLGGRSTSGTVFPLKEIVAGQSVINGTGFGDYVAAAQDPTDGSVWLINQYAGPAGRNNADNNTVGCKVVHVELPN